MAPMPTWPSGRRGRAQAIALGIAVAALIAYLPSLSGGFVFDDHVAGRALPRCCAGPLWRIWFSSDPVDYWPLTNSALWLEWRAFGAAPLGYRLVNLAAARGRGGAPLARAGAAASPGGLAGWAPLRGPPGDRGVGGLDLGAQEHALRRPLLGACLAWLGFRDSGRQRAAALARSCSSARCSPRPRPSCSPSAADDRPRSSAGVRPARIGVARAGSSRWRSCSARSRVWFQWIRSHGRRGSTAASPSGSAARAGPGAAYLWTAFQPFAAAVVYADWPVRPDDRPGSGLPLAAGLLGLRRAVGAPDGAGRDRSLLALGYHALAVLPVLGLVEMALHLFSPDRRTTCSTSR